MEYHFICDAGIKGVGEPETVAGECRFIIIWQVSLSLIIICIGPSLSLTSSSARYLRPPLAYTIAY